VGTGGGGGGWKLQKPSFCWTSARAIGWLRFSRLHRVQIPEMSNIRPSLCELERDWTLKTSGKQEPEKAWAVFVFILYTSSSRYQARDHVAWYREDEVHAVGESYLSRGTRRYGNLTLSRSSILHRVQTVNEQIRIDHVSTISLAFILALKSQIAAKFCLAVLSAAAASVCRSPL
jgi:hypothetical protein